jgi:hypothetical protein
MIRAKGEAMAPGFSQSIHEAKEWIESEIVPPPETAFILPETRILLSERG